jgi:putative SOS response-associated peptidase YedK
MRSAASVCAGKIESKHRRSFKDAVVSHRCAIAVNGFIDWETDGEENKWPIISPCQMSAPFSATSLAN